MLKILIAIGLLLGLVAGDAVAGNAHSPDGAPGGWSTSARSALVVRIYYTDRRQLAPLIDEIDLWAVYPDRVEALVTPPQFFWLLARGYRVEIDQARTARLTQPRLIDPLRPNSIPGYACYRTVEETYATAQQIVAAHPTLAQWIDIGDSWEKVNSSGQTGYDLEVLKLTNFNRAGPKPRLFIMSSIHAREYAPAEINTRFAEYLINHYGVDADVTWLLDETEIHLLLQANPDGRKQAEAGQWWRKNTNNAYCSDSPDRGADLNRNFPFAWNGCTPGDGCSSNHVCSETYRGPSPASEPETQAVVNYVRAQYLDLRLDDLSAAAPITTSGLFMDLHSYGDLVLWPWGFTAAPSPNGTALQTLGRKFAYFNDYTPTPSIGLYPTDGTTDDFAYGELGVAAYTFEVGTDFFQDCASFENVIWPTNLPALIYAAKSARQPYLTPAGPDTLAVSVAMTTTVQGWPARLTAQANDTRYKTGSGEAVQNIVGARYTIDAPTWATGVISHPLAAADGAFDAPTEALSADLDTSALTSGHHLIFVESQDAAGHWGPPTATFIWVGEVKMRLLLPVIQATLK